MDAGTTSLLCLPHLLTQCVHECRAPSHRADSGHISFGGIVQSPSVATVAANIEAVGAPLALKAPDLLPRVPPPVVTPPQHHIVHGLGKLVAVRYMACRCPCLAAVCEVNAGRCMPSQRAALCFYSR